MSTARACPKHNALQARGWQSWVPRRSPRDLQQMPHSYNARTAKVVHRLLVCGRTSHFGSGDCAELTLASRAELRCNASALCICCCNVSVSGGPWRILPERYCKHLLTSRHRLHCIFADIGIGKFLSKLSKQEQQWKIYQSWSSVLAQQEQHWHSSWHDWASKPSSCHDIEVRQTHQGHTSSISVRWRCLEMPVWRHVY